MKYKVGDKVRIAGNHTETKYYWNDEMLKRQGESMTVRELFGSHSYKMEEDKEENSGHGWAWSEGMIAGLANENKMPEVAALLGVEIGEEFDIDGNGLNPHKFTMDGVVDCDGDIFNGRLNCLLTGEWKIIKKPWAPKDGKRFYFITPSGEVDHAYFYDTNNLLNALVRSGNGFRTPREAEVNREDVMEKFKWK